MLKTTPQEKIQNIQKNTAWEISIEKIIQRRKSLIFIHVVINVAVAKMCKYISY